MIRINLLGEKADKTGLYVLQLIGLSVAAVVVISIGGVFHSDLKEELELASNNQQMLTTQLIQLKKKTKKVEELEEKRKLIREKLRAIATLKANKQGPVNILNDIATLIPERAWLTEIKDREGVLEVSGVALDNQTIAEFMNKLENSQFFENVDLKQAQQIIKEDVKLKSFSVSVGLVNLLDLKKSQNEARDASGLSDKKEI